MGWRRRLILKAFFSALCPTTKPVNLSDAKTIAYEQKYYWFCHRLAWRTIRKCLSFKTRKRCSRFSKIPRLEFSRQWSKSIDTHFFLPFFLYLMFFYILPWTFFPYPVCFLPFFIIVALVAFVFPNSFITLIRKKTEKKLLPFKTTQRAWIYLFSFFFFLIYDFLCREKGFFPSTWYITFGFHVFMKKKVKFLNKSGRLFSLNIFMCTVYLCKKKVLWRQNNNVVFFKNFF